MLPKPKFEIPKKTENKGEAAAQKPDVKLTPDLLAGQSPLASHLQKSIEQRGRKGHKGEEPQERDEVRKSAKEEQSLKRDRRRGSKRLMDEVEGEQSCKIFPSTFPQTCSKRYCPKDIHDD
ncbi:MAG: hypothetical protein R3C11_20270 [Planctomycetaceae bacterium]